MALDTSPALQKQVIYSVYLRAHSEEGSFRALIPDLDRIRALGTDIIWLMPIHPIGVEGKKGSLGCPYANRDYRDVNPAYGTMEDFRALCGEIRARGMKVIIDVVYNHTSPDSVLFHEHPEFFYRNADGKPANKLGDWADVIDLDYRVPALWDYQIESLRFWATMVDGFRCDVATLVPLDFWKKARAAVAEVRPGAIWLAESVHLSFGCYARRSGFNAVRDSELFEAFDLEYEYDVREIFEQYLRGEAPLSAWMSALNFQEAVYPENYNKLRFLENHDQPRFASLVSDERALRNYTALLFALKGTTLLYAGQEWENTRTPSLFERELIDRETGKDLSPLLSRLAAIKKEYFGGSDAFWAGADDAHELAVILHGRCRGVFSLKGASASAAVDAPDGVYENLIDGSPVEVRGGRVLCAGEPILFALG